MKARVVEQWCWENERVLNITVCRLQKYQLVDVSLKIPCRHHSIQTYRINKERDTRAEFEEFVDKVFRLALCYEGIQVVYHGCDAWDPAYNLSMISTIRSTCFIFVRNSICFLPEVYSICHFVYLCRRSNTYIHRWLTSIQFNATNFCPFPRLSAFNIHNKRRKGRRRRRRRKRSFLSIHFKFQGDPILGLDAVFCSHNVSSPSENFWHGIPMSALLWVSISLVEQKLGESPPYVSSKAICRSLMVCSRICSVFVGWKSIHVAAGSQGVHHEYPMPSTCVHHLEPLSTGIVCYSYSCEVWKSQAGSWRPVFSTGLVGSGFTSRVVADRLTCWLTSPW